MATGATAIENEKISIKTNESTEIFKFAEDECIIAEGFNFFGKCIRNPFMMFYRPSYIKASTGTVKHPDSMGFAINRRKTN